MSVQRCRRCGSLMFWDLFIASGGVFEAWHCPICGEIWDQQIHANRLHHLGLSRRHADKRRRHDSFRAPDGRQRHQPVKAVTADTPSR